MAAPVRDRSDPAYSLTPAELAPRIQHMLVGQAITESSWSVGTSATPSPWGSSAVVVPGVWARLARHLLRNSSVKLGATIDFPYGSSTTAARVAEASALVEAGVDEIDATVPIGVLLSGRGDEFFADLQAVVAAADPVGVRIHAGTAAAGSAPTADGRRGRGRCRRPVPARRTPRGETVGIAGRPASPTCGRWCRRRRSRASKASGRIKTAARRPTRSPESCSRPAPT